MEKSDTKKISWKRTKNTFYKFRTFLQKDSFVSVCVYILLVFLFLLLIFFPILRLITGTAYPLVIVESCSMYHNQYGFENVLSSDIYAMNGIFLKDTENWDFQRGLNKGDIIFIINTKNIDVGDVIIFNGGSQHPIIHRVIDNVDPYQTKGDNFATNYGQLSTEKNISSEQIYGKAIFKIPYLGWVKLIFFDWQNSKENRGLCKI